MYGLNNAMIRGAGGLLVSLLIGAQTALAADITILGEVHDNPDAHLGQAEMLSALRPTAVIFEMLTPQEAARADKDRSQLPKIWATGQWPDFELYVPIFKALGSAEIVGAASPRAEIMEIFRAGPSAAYGLDLQRFGLDLPLPPEQQAQRETLQFDAHCQAMPREMMAGMVHVQRFRDAVMANAALDALARLGPPVAIIAGNGHARTDWGIPAMIRTAAPGTETAAIAFVEGDTDMPFDKVRRVPPAKREDPCKALRK